MGRPRSVRGGKKRTLYLSQAAWEKAQAKAKKSGLSISQLITALIEAI